MDYDKEQFFGLIEQVEAQGGEHLNAMCVARDFDWSGDKLPRATLPGCGQLALFTVPYKHLTANSKGMKVLVDSTVQVCAVDDDMGRWPRFGGDRFGKDD